MLAGNESKEGRLMAAAQGTLLKHVHGKPSRLDQSWTVLPGKSRRDWTPLQAITTT